MDPQQPANPLPAQNPQNPPNRTGSAENIFESLLEKTKQEKTQQGEESKILSGVIEQKHGEGNILGPLPQRKDLMMMRMKKRGSLLSFGWILVELAIVTLVVSYSYFYYELTPTATQLDSYLGRSNSINELDRLKNDVVTEQGKINANNLLAVQMQVDNLTYQLDSYFINKEKPNISPKDTKAKTALKKISDSIISSFEFIQGRLKEKPFIPEAISANPDFNSELTPRILEETRRQIQEFSQNGQHTFLGPKTFEGAGRLLGDSGLISTLIGININSYKEHFKSDPTTKNSDEETDPDEDLKQVLISLNNVAQNDFSIFSKLRQNRVPWTTFIKFIETLTKDTDDYYDKPEARQIFYSSYSFNGKDRKISVTGQVRKRDEKNFALMSKLIETFEKSDDFSDVSIGSFSKTKQGKYTTSPLNITFTMQGTDCDPRDFVYSLEEYIERYKTEGSVDFNKLCAKTAGSEKTSAD